jgi:hypothetical protein
MARIMICTDIATGIPDPDLMKDFYVNTNEFGFIFIFKNDELYVRKKIIKKMFEKIKKKKL